MGNRRFSRKRLFETEKLGKAVELGAGAGIKDAIVSATQHRNGAEIITEIAVDLGTSKADIIDGSAATGVIGVASATDSSLAELTVAKFGNITEIRCVCVEALAMGIDLALTSAAAATDSTQTTLADARDINVVGEDKTATFSTIANVNGKFLHLCQGTSSGGVNSATALASGKFLIYIHGFAAPSDI